MRSAWWQRLAFWAAMPLAVVAPFALFFGRFMLGVGGWTTIAIFSVASFVLFVGLLVIGLLVWVRRSRITPAAAGPVTSLLLFACALFVTVLVVGVGDFGDDSDWARPPLARWGVPLDPDANGVMFFVGTIGAGVTLLGGMVAAVVELARLK